MQTAIRTLANDEFLRSNLVLFCGSLIAAGFNYLYHPAMGRMLGVEEFGEVQTIISLALQLAVLGGVFKTMVASAVANGKSGEPVETLYQAAAWLFLALVLTLIVLSPALGAFFHFQSPYPFLALGLILLTGLPLFFGEGVLQGRSRFRDLSLSQSLTASGKLFFAVLFVVLGASALGAVSALIAAQLLDLLYLKRQGALPALGRGVLGLRRAVQRHRGYAFMVTIVSLMIATLLSFDTLAVKHYFSAETAGLYGGVAIIAKIIYFATASIAGVLLSSVRLDAGAADNGRLLRRSLLLSALVGLPLCLSFALFPALFITVLLGARYLAYAPLLAPLSFAFFLVSVANLLFTYMLALRDRRAGTAAALGLAVILLLADLNHASLAAIIQDLMAASVFAIGTAVLLRARPDGARASALAR